MKETHTDGSECVWSTWRDPFRVRWVVQHGDNPEAQLHLDDCVTVQHRRDLQHEVDAWLQRVHAYEQGDAA
jgi:hypothetical protein